MSQYGVSTVVTFDAWYAGTRKTGDAANITCQLSQNGAKAVASTNSPTEILKADNSPSGRYKLTLTANERAYNSTRVQSDSVTSGVVLPDVSIISDQLRGARAITITVTEADTTPIPAVCVAVYDSTQTNVVALCTTDAAGIACIQNTTSLAYLDAGSYEIVCSKPGVNFTNPTSLTVDGTESVAIEGTVVDPGSPAANLCRVSGYVKRADETLVPGPAGKFVAKLATTPFIASGTVFSGKEVVGVADATAWAYVDLEREATVNMEVRDGTMTIASFKVTIPDQANITIEALYALA